MFHPSIGHIRSDCQVRQVIPSVVIAVEVESQKLFGKKKKGEGDAGFCNDQQERMLETWQIRLKAAEQKK